MPDPDRCQEPVPAITIERDELAKLLRKLRWIGLEEEAARIENALSSIPADRRPSVLGVAPSTD